MGEYICANLTGELLWLDKLIGRSILSDLLGISERWSSKRVPWHFMIISKKSSSGGGALKTFNENCRWARFLLVVATFWLVARFSFSGSPFRLRAGGSTARWSSMRRSCMPAIKSIRSSSTTRDLPLPPLLRPEVPGTLEQLAIGRGCCVVADIGNLFSLLALTSIEHRWSSIRLLWNLETRSSRSSLLLEMYSKLVARVLPFDLLDSPLERGLLESPSSGSSLFMLVRLGCIILFTFSLLVDSLCNFWRSWAMLKSAFFSPVRSPISRDISKCFCI